MASQVDVYSHLSSPFSRCNCKSWTCGLSLICLDLDALLETRPERQELAAVQSVSSRTGRLGKSCWCPLRRKLPPAVQTLGDGKRVSKTLKNQSCSATHMYRMPVQERAGRCTSSIRTSNLQGGILRLRVSRVDTLLNVITHQMHKLFPDLFLVLIFDGNKGQYISPELLVTFLIAMTKYLVQETWEREDLFGLLVLENSPSWQGRHGSSGYRIGRLLSWVNQEAEREVWLPFSYLSPFSPLVLSGTPAYGVLPPTSTVVPFSVDPLWKPSQTPKVCLLVLWI